MKKLIPFAVAAGLALSGCASSGGGSMSSSNAMHTANDATAAIKAAEQELMKARAVHNEWRDTGKMIAQAKKDEKAGKYNEAVKIADAAMRQSKNALIQYQDQRNATQR